MFFSLYEVTPMTEPEAQKALDRFPAVDFRERERLEYIKQYEEETKRIIKENPNIKLI